MNGYTQLDDQLKVLKQKGLNWLPWIGHNYFNLPLENRIVIIGESHYENGERPDRTREMIIEDTVKSNEPFFQNLHKPLFRDNQFSIEKLWEQVSFYNLIQRPMETRDERPNRGDYYLGWEVFAALNELLLPDIYLFIGVGSAKENYLTQAASAKSDIRFDTIKTENKINGTFPRLTSIYNVDNKKASLIFIKHTSSYFSWDEWNKFLENKIGQKLQWLKDEIK